MKCGIITFHRAVNFGAVMQTYALNKTINNLGVDCDVLDYRSPFLEKHYEPVSFKTFLNLRQLAILLLKNGTVKDNRANFRAFSDKYIKKSTTVFNSKEDLVKSNKEYDIFITGSDQVWSYYVAGFDKSYFLDFVSDDRKKNSYAASFGVSKIPNEHKETYKELLTGYENISLREKQGVPIVKEAVDREPTVVLDPSLLLNKEEWETIAQDNDQNSKYLLVYLLAETKSILKLAKKIANERNLKIIYINDRLFERSGMENASKIKPERWLSLFLHAEYIVTNSFHGICFSINFQKEFYMQYLPEPAKVNSRLENILELFGLKNRCVSDLTKLCINNKIDYSKVNILIEKEREKSLNYLKKVLNKD